jgi:hypothetical protein
MNESEFIGLDMILIGLFLSYGTYKKGGLNPHLFSIALSLIAVGAIEFFGRIIMHMVSFQLPP